MNLLPQASGTRPRIACEITAQGVVAARADSAATPLTAVARVTLSPGAVVPGLRPGNLVDRVAVVAAIRKALEDTGLRANTRGADITLILPDAAVRVLLLDFDALPNKLTEALPIVRFRLKKMLPFDADNAAVSFQVMSTSRQLVRVLAVAIPPDVLAEYESAAREAGFEPGAVIPSTLAALAAVDDSAESALLINANSAGVTTAITRHGLLLLHRSVDLQPHAPGLPANLPPALFDNPGASPLIPLVDVDHTAAEWAAQEPLPEHGHNPYAGRELNERAVQDEDGITNLPVPPVFLSEPSAPPTTEAATSLFVPAPADLDTEIAEAVSVAAAYFEDTLSAAPTRILSAGPLGAEALQRLLTAAGIAQAEGLHVREAVTADHLLPAAVTASVPRGWLAAVTGALRG